MKQQSGFTLIELVVVIVLLGILGAAATAKFQDLSTEARTAALKGIAAEMASGSAINYAKGQTQSPVAYPAVIDNCQDGPLVLQQAALPSATMSIGDVGCAGEGQPVNCSLSDSAGGTAAAFTLICTAAAAP